MGYTIVNYIGVAFAAILVQNIILTQFLGLCSFFGVGNKEKSAIGMGLAVTFVIFISSIVTYFIYIWFLLPNNLTGLATIIFILIIAALVQFVEMFIKRFSPSLYQSLGIYLPLITTNCAVLGVALLNVKTIDANFVLSSSAVIYMLIFSLFTPLGYAFVIYLFATIREQIAKAPLHPALNGVPIALITAFVMAMAFAGFVGIASV